VDGSVTHPDDDTRRALDALRRATAPGPDDLDHPGYEALEALVDERLSDVDREIVLGHVDLCATCAEDVADLTAVKFAAVFAPAPARRGSYQYVVSGFSKTGVKAAMFGGSIAAGLLLVVWLGNRGPATVSTTASTTTPTQTAVPAVSPDVASGSGPTGPASPVEPAAASLLTVGEQAVVTAAIGSGRLELPAVIQALAGQTGTLLGGVDDAGPFGPVEPMGRVVLEPRPRFSWSPVTGATGYTVAVFDDRFNEVARGQATATPGGGVPQWTPPAELARGRNYVWQVTAHLPSGDISAPSPPKPEARFRVLDAAAAAVVAEQQRRLASEPLALGVLLAKAGLLTEAERELARAGAPGSALLASLRE
jgi:hypothetical protein